MKKLNVKYSSSIPNVGIEFKIIHYFLIKFNELSIFLDLFICFILKSNIKLIVERFLIYSGPLRSILIFYHRLINAGKNYKRIENNCIENINIEEIGAELIKKGYSDKITLSETIVKDILEYTSFSPAVTTDNRFTVINSDTLTAPVKGVFNYFYYNPHNNCKTVYDIANSMKVIEVVRNYLKADPILYSSKLYWSFPRTDNNGKILNQGDRKLFHYDVSDSKSLSLFFYLTDVDELSGPHTIIENTHGNRKLYQIFRGKISDEEAARKYGSRIKNILGKRGSGFFEDLLNYHKHSWAFKKEPRLVLSLCYTINRKPEKKNQESIF